MRDTHAAGSIGGLILGAACKQYPHRKVGSDTSNILKRSNLRKNVSFEASVVSLTDSYLWMIMVKVAAQWKVTTGCIR